jgi:multidrug resistance efflux pump
MSPAPIPIPWQQRWRDVRLRYVPALIFIAIVFVLALLWKDYSSAPLLVGQAEVVPANVSCYRPGMLAQLTVNRFQKVKAGDAIGQVQVTDPRILAASLAVIQAEIASLRANQQPIANEQRLAMEFSEMNLNWMSQRAQLGAAQADLLVAEADFHRTEELFKDKIVSERSYDLAKAKQDSLRNKVAELVLSVKQQEGKIQQLQPTNTIEISKVTTDPLQAAIAAEESKLQYTEADLSPITLRASVDGMIDVIYHRVGEAVTAGEPIVAIAPFNAIRIIGYLRPPLLEEPKVGASVEVRTRGPRPQSATAEILEVGNQFEPLPPALQIPIRMANAELGLPLCVSVPPILHIRPGELLDLQLLPASATTNATTTAAR